MAIQSVENKAEDEASTEPHVAMTCVIELKSKRNASTTILWWLVVLNNRWCNCSNTSIMER